MCGIVRHTQNSLGHESTPEIGGEAEGVVNKEFPVGGNRFDNEEGVPVELFEDGHGGHFPRFVDGFQSEDGGVVLVFFGNDADHFERVLNVCVVNVGVLVEVDVVVTQPMGRSDRPMLKGDQTSGIHGQIGCPLEQHGLTGVVETVLRSLVTVNVNERLNAVLLTPLQELVNVGDRAIHTTNFRRQRQQQKECEK